MPKKHDLAVALNKAVKAPALESQSKPQPQQPTKSVEVELSKNDIPPSRKGKKAITGFFDPAVSKQFKLIGIEQDKTLQAMMAEAFNDYFEKHGKNPIA